MGLRFLVLWRALPEVVAGTAAFRGDVAGGVMPRLSGALDDSYKYGQHRQSRRCLAAAQ